MERKGKSKEIMVAFLILIMGLMMAFMVPTWETPDEYTHLWMIGDSIGKISKICQIGNVA